MLGGLELRRGGESLPPLSSGRAASLLGHLLLHRQAAQPRQRLAFMLWPDSSEPQARTNLRHLVHELRRSQPDIDRFLDIRPPTLQWRTDVLIRLDVAAFEEFLALSQRSSDAAAIVALQHAVDVYGGDLLEGCYDDGFSPSANG